MVVVAAAVAAVPEAVVSEQIVVMVLVKVSV